MFPFPIAKKENVFFSANIDFYNPVSTTFLALKKLVILNTNTKKFYNIKYLHFVHIV